MKQARSADSVRNMVRTRLFWWVAVAVVAYTTIIFVGGAFAGKWASGRNLKSRIAAVIGLSAKTQTEGNQDPSAKELQSVSWSRFETNLHSLDLATVTLAPFQTNGKGGALEEIEGNIVFASPLGNLGYLTPGMEIRTIDARVPVNFDELSKSDIARHPSFAPPVFRVLDLLSVKTSTGAYDLYASYHRFTGTCFEVVISKLTLQVDQNGIHPASGNWEDVLVAKPCILPKKRANLFSGNESGGRMVRSGDTLLVALGDLQFNGVDDDVVFAQDPAIDFGKVLAIDLRTHKPRIHAYGLRNPQGFLAAADGTIWETEHGPQGGDEINIIRQGANYGWPLVTYGVNYSYGGPMRDWAPNKTQGRHDGFEKPVFAFVPSIGISNLIVPNAEEFPLWRDCLLVGSLSSQKLFLVRLEDGRRAAYIETLSINNSVRDMLALSDGRIAILSDEGNLLLVRNAELANKRHQDATAATTFEVRMSSTALEAARGTPRLVAGMEYGQEQFWKSCSTCHSLSGVLGVGPPLNGVIGRRIGSAADFHYSAPLAKQDKAWSEDLVYRFLIDPDRGGLMGTAMPKQQIDKAQAQAIAKFLSRTSAN